MDQDKIGQFIKSLRDEQGMSQEQLAQKLKISRQVISKWELGKSLPDGLMIKELSKIFKVSANEILNGKKGKESDTLTLNMYESRKKALRIIRYLVFFIIVLLLAFFIYYFITSFNSIKVYTISGESEKMTIANGILVDTNEKIYFQLGEIRNKSEEKILNINLYYTENGKNIEIYTCEECNLTKLNFIDYKAYNEYIDSSKIDYIISNLFIDTKFSDDTQETIRLNVKRDFSNNKFFNKNYSERINEIEQDKKQNFTFDNNMITNIKKHFKKSDDGYVYNYKDKEKKIDASYFNNGLSIDIYENKEVEYWSINFETKIIGYEKYIKDKQVEQTLFNIDDKDSYSQEYEKFINIIEFIFSN